MALLLWLIGIVLVIWGFFHIITSGFFWGLVLLVAGVAVVMWGANRYH